MSSDTRERLRRLLFLVPYVARHPGIGVDALAERLSITREQLLEELDLLVLVGRPPFQPDDYIDIRVENDRVWVELDARLSAPPRLTAAEAVALAAAAEGMGAAGGEVLASALARLEAVLPPGARAAYREMARKLDTGADVPGELAPLSQALTERREVSFDYVAVGRTRAERRRVRPHELITHRGQWYLSGFDVGRGEERLFRLDRLQGLTLEQARFTPPAQVRQRTLLSGAGGQEVRVRFSAQVAPYVRERFSGGVVGLEGGGVEVTVAVDSETWLTRWVLSYGGEAQVVEPAWARQAVARAARASLDS